MPKNPVKFFHLYYFSEKEQGNYRITIATIVMKDKFEIPFVKIGIAYCSPKDNFTKARGRQIAEGRAIKSGIEYAWKGHSADDIVEYWNEMWGHKPQALKHTLIYNVPEYGLTIREN